MLYVSHIPLVNALNFVNLPLVSKGPSFIIDDQNLGLRAEYLRCKICIICISGPYLNIVNIQ